MIALFKVFCTNELGFPLSALATSVAREIGSELGLRLDKRPNGLPDFNNRDAKWAVSAVRCTRDRLAFAGWSKTATAQKIESIYIYVTVNLRNQIFPRIPNPLRESGESEYLVNLMFKDLLT